MQELVGRLTALDPEASESLKVIAYFDVLVNGHASMEVLLRGAAVLGGCPAGFATDRIVASVDAHGKRLPTVDAPESGRWMEHAVPGGARAWMEREGPQHANDEMILERLAIALGIMLERSAPQAAIRKAVETVIDFEESPENRRTAASRLRLDPLGRFVVIAEPASSPSAHGHNTVVVTPAGAVRAVITAESERAPGSRAGVGVAVHSDELDRSWATALTALRLTSDREPVVWADDLGGLILLMDAAEARGADHADLAALRAAIDGSPRALSVLEAVIHTDSLRAAATEAGLHHSTIQARVAELSSTLGFDVRTAAGRTRLAIALSLYRLVTNRFS